MAALPWHADGLRRHPVGESLIVTVCALQHTPRRGFTGKMVEMAARRVAFCHKRGSMKCSPMRVFAIITAGSLALVCSAEAQRRGRSTTTTRTTTVSSIQERYGIQDAYDGTSLHPDGRRSAAVPVTMDDGRTGEFVIPSERGPHAVYYRDDQTGDFHPVRKNDHATRQQYVEAPRAVRYQPEPQHSNKRSWEQEALIVGGGAAGGALIGATAGGKKGAGVGAATGGVGGLIYDLLSRNKR